MAHVEAEVLDVGGTGRMTMSTMNPSTVLVSDSPFEQAHMAAASFLARYSGRTLETYRYDLRSYFEWCASVDLGGRPYAKPPFPGFARCALAVAPAY